MKRPNVQELKDLAEGELLRQLNRKNMVELVSIGDLHNAHKIFEAALKMTKSNMAWLRNQVNWQGSGNHLKIKHCPKPMDSLYKT